MGEMIRNSIGTSLLTNQDFMVRVTCKSLDVKTSSNNTFKIDSFFIKRNQTSTQNMYVLTVLQLSNEQTPGCLGYIEDYTTQLYGGYSKPF